MLFEGSEKKLEVVVASEVGDLRTRGDDFWYRLVQSVDAQVLSKLHRADCDAYLLSESSLFVWEHKFTMITCGRTTLVQALPIFLQTVPIDKIEFLVFERKNEYFPRQQKTDFFSDLDTIRRLAPGHAYRFGHAGEHHIFLFHLDRPFKPARGDVTTELLMHHIGGAARDLFGSKGQQIATIRHYLQLDGIFPGYAWDDYLFEPVGYSVNGIKGKRYVTIHVTPQDGGSYVSLETNADFGENLSQVLSQVVTRFQPQSFDVMTFRPDDKQVSFEAPDYWRVNRVEEKLKCGYRVNYTSHYLTHSAVQPSQILEV
ncbi:MAG: adenosylmethionine decarboxylase [Bdellovibrionales bacterium]